MNLKLFELRDRATFIPIFAFQTIPPSSLSDPKENWLMRKAGYGIEHPPVIIGVLNCKTPEHSHCTYDPSVHGDRTFGTAHAFIEKHWDALNSGDVIDVEFLLGEKFEMAESDRIS